MVVLMGASFVGIVTPPVVMPATTATTPPTVNAAYAVTGNLLNGTSGLLAPNQIVVVQVLVAINPNATAMLMNQATGRGTGPGPVTTPVEVSDLSDNGLLFESNNPGQLGDTGGQNDKTIIQLPKVGVSKSVAFFGGSCLPARAAGRNVRGF